ncbi:DEAD/DEAH box helicase [Priestia koreensis]|uniref:DEAD/DEAH box helicase n=1 Tax=Priestia koreensis TaxID=284581 RepID=UPI003015B0B8
MTVQWSFFKEMKPFLQKVWQKSGFENPTSIQEKAVPLLVDKKDVIAESPTGTGKTLAYVMPLLQNIDSTNTHIQAVILAPSRELVMQILSEVQTWAEGSSIDVASFIGGVNVKRQLEKLKKRPQIVVGTPGRIQELIKMKKIKMHEVKTIVLDEGDNLLVPEHQGTVEMIVKSALAERQVVLFSATLPDHTEKLARSMMNDPEVLKVKQSEEAKAKVEHLYVVAEHRDKMEVLRRIMHTGKLTALGFVKDIGSLSVLTEKLAYRGIDVGALHSEVKKEERVAAIRKFREGKYPLLLATDVAARGLDINGLSHVIHVDFPLDVNQYIHRSGRTGRAGASGTVISIVTPREERVLKQFAKEQGIKVHKREVIGGNIVEPENRPVEQHKTDKKYPKSKNKSSNSKKYTKKAKK